MDRATLTRPSDRAARRRAPSAAPLAWPLVAVLALLLPVADVTLAPAASAGGFLDDTSSRKSEQPQYAVPAKRQEVEGDGVEALSAELSNAKMRLGEAIQNESSAAYNLQRARTRRYPRGEALEELRKGAVDTASERRAAEQDYRAMIEKARREGVPAGTLMGHYDYLETIERKSAQEQDQ